MDVNLFTHYRPIEDGDDWWQMADTVPKSPSVMEAEGECHLDADKLRTLGEQLGAVRCDDNRLGTNISPAMAKASNADDLIAWWMYTSPDNEDETFQQRPAPVPEPSQ